MQRCNSVHTPQESNLRFTYWKRRGVKATATTQTEAQGHPSEPEFAGRCQLCPVTSVKVQDLYPRGLSPNSRQLQRSLQSVRWRVSDSPKGSYNQQSDFTLKRWPHSSSLFGTYKQQSEQDLGERLGSQTRGCNVPWDTWKCQDEDSPQRNKEKAPTFPETGLLLDGDEEWTCTSLCHLPAGSQNSLHSVLCPRQREWALR